MSSLNVTNDQIKQVLKKIVWVPVGFLYLQYIINPFFYLVTKILSAFN